MKKNIHSALRALSALAKVVRDFSRQGSRALGQRSIFKTMPPVNPARLLLATVRRLKSRTTFLLAALALATTAHAGTFSTAAWTNDASTGITAGQTSWVFHFGAATAATVNSVGVTGIASTNAAPYSRAEFDLAGLTSVFNADTNNVTGTGSAVIAHDFVYGGNPGTLTVKGLTSGNAYTVSFLSVGFEAAGGRQVTFTSGTDSLLVNQDQFGDNNGIRVDYTFTATAATRVITLTPQGAATFHLYGLALRQGFVVANANDSGAGSLRQALTDAAALPGPDTITFASGLGPIVLASEIVVADTGGVTVDATALAAGVTLNGNAHRIFSVSAGASLTLENLTLTGGNGVGATASNTGGAIYNAGTLTASRCTLTTNTASAQGGAVRTVGTLTLTDCTLAANTAATSGGAVASDAGSAASFTRCTFSGNTANSAALGGGAINHSSGALSCTLTHCTLTGNNATGGASSGGGGIRNRGANLTLNYCLIAGNLCASGTGPDVNSTVAFTLGGANLIQTAIAGGGTVTGPAPITTAPSLGALASNGGPTQTHALLAGSAGINAATGSAATVDQRGFPVVGTPDLGAYEFGGGLNVTTSADSGPGSLRAALANAALLPGADTITFDPALSGQTLALASEIVMAMDGVGNVTVDASSLPGGLTLSGGGTHRILSVSSSGGASGTVTLVGLTLTGGNGVGASNSGIGGAILNVGNTLTLTRCTLSGNATSINGGAIGNGGVLTLTQCTLSGNSAGDRGGAIYNGGGTLTLANSIVAGNAAPSGGADIYNDGQFVPSTVTRVGANLVQSLFTNGGLATVTGSGTISTADPLLAPLADNGGPTKTMALLPGSPALDAVPAGSIIAALTTDQRGFPRNRDGDATAGALPDIGAYEAQVAPFALGFNFVGGGPAGSTGTLASTDVAGAFAQANWNNLTTDYDGTSSGTYANGPASIKDGGGISFSPNLKLWWDAPNTYGKAAAGLITPDQKLMGGYLDSDASGNGSAATNLYSGTTAQPFFALGGLPAAATLGGYKVIVYTDIAATDGRISRYWLTSNRGQNPASVGGESALTGSYFTRDTSDFSGTYTRATATTDATATPGGNYVQFDGLTEPGGFIVRAEEGSQPVGNQGRAPINAVQIVRNEIIVVTTTQDENDPSGTPGAGVSLREALRDAPDGAGIVFDSTLNGLTLTLTGGEIVIAKNVTIDASSLPAGVTISGGGTSRIFTVNSGKTVALQNLTLTGGNGVGTVVGNNGNGGTIFNNGTLTLTRCTLSGNSATFGGAIYNDGTLTLTHCTLSGNSASQGGAIYNDDGTLTLANSIVAANTAPSGGADIFNGGNSATVTRVGANLVQTLTHANGGTGTGSGTISNALPLLAPLAAYGGPTKTMALLPGSPARDAATNSTITSDQRGFPIVGGTPDIGAYEAGTFTNYNTYIWESLPTAGNGTLADPQHATTFDFDHDGVTNFNEWLALTNPGDPKSTLRILTATRTGDNVNVTFPTVLGRNYTFEYTTALSLSPATVWTPIPGTFPGNGSVQGFPIGPFPGQPRVFLRIRVGP